MANHKNPNLALELLQMLQRHLQRFLIPVIAVTLMAAVYALLRPATWEAAQALVVRNVASSRVDGARADASDLGEEMKTVQETILELARGRGVLTQVLLKDHSNGTTPTATDVAKLRKNVTLTPPNGSEFGSTEVFYLKVRDTTPERAIALTTSLSEVLQEHLKILRNKIAESMMAEISQNVALNREELAATTEKLARMEAKVGSDLAELRILHQSPSGNSDLRHKKNQLEDELRGAREAFRANLQLRMLLTSAMSDAGQLLATPNRLLDSQPALRRLKDGLIDAKLRTAQLKGSRSAQHPYVLATVAAEKEISQDLSNELEIAIRGIKVDEKLTVDRVATLEKQLVETTARLSKISGMRASYANLLEEIDQRNKILNASEDNLANAQASHAAFQSASLITLIDTPDVGNSPVGLRRSLIIALGLAAGLAIGSGVLLLTVQPSQTEPKVEPAKAFEPGPNTLADRNHGVSLERALKPSAESEIAWS